MATFNKRKELLSSELEARVNKSASICAFDRFGADNSIVLRQIQETRRSLESFQRLKEKSIFEHRLESVQIALSEKRKEYIHLSRINKDHLVNGQELCDRVEELKEEIQSEFSFLEESFTRSSENGHGRLHDDDIAATIIGWKLDSVPSPSVHDTI